MFYAAKELAGYHREWPPDIEMSTEIRERVSRRWAELGLDDIITPAGS